MSTDDAPRPSNSDLDPHDWLRCLWTGAKLRRLSVDECQRINRSILAGEVFNSVGRRTTEPLLAGFVDASGTWAYRVRQGVPQMVRGEALKLCGLDLLDVVEPTDGNDTHP